MCMINLLNNLLDYFLWARLKVIAYFPTSKISLIIMTSGPMRAHPTSSGVSSATWTTTDKNPSKSNPFFSSMLLSSLFLKASPSWISWSQQVQNRNFPMLTTTTGQFAKTPEFQRRKTTRKQAIPNPKGRHRIQKLKFSKNRTNNSRKNCNKKKNHPTKVSKKWKTKQKISPKTTAKLSYPLSKKTDRTLKSSQNITTSTMINSC